LADRVQYLLDELQRRLYLWQLLEEFIQLIVFFDYLITKRPLTYQKSTLRVLLHSHFLVIAIAATSMLSTVALPVPFHRWREKARLLTRISFGANWRANDFARNHGNNAMDYKRERLGVLSKRL
jgi:hypothetical protein